MYNDYNDYEDDPVICDLLTFYWTPDEDQTCLTMTYFIYINDNVIDSKIVFITADIYDENNMLLSSTVLKNYVINSYYRF